MSLAGQVAALTTRVAEEFKAVRSEVAASSSGYATAAQGALADSATQPGDLANVATSGSYADLTGTPAAQIIYLAVGAPVPGGTPANTLIVRPA